jgi:hypothetical protein
MESVIMRSLHDVHKLRRDHVRPHISTREQLDGFRLNSYESCATGGYYSLVLFNFLQSVSNNNMADARTCEVEATIVPLLKLSMVAFSKK